MSSSIFDSFLAFYCKIFWLQSLFRHSAYWMRLPKSGTCDCRKQKQNTRRLKRWNLTNDKFFVCNFNPQILFCGFCCRPDEPDVVKGLACRFQLFWLSFDQINLKELSQINRKKFFRNWSTCSASCQRSRKLKLKLW